MITPTDIIYLIVDVIGIACLLGFFLGVLLAFFSSRRNN